MVTKGFCTSETPQPTRTTTDSRNALESAFTPNQPKLNTPVTFACYTVLRCVLQVLLLIWEGQPPRGCQAHWGKAQRSGMLNPLNCSAGLSLFQYGSQNRRRNGLPKDGTPSSFGHVVESADMLTETHCGERS